RRQRPVADDEPADPLRPRQPERPDRDARRDPGLCQRLPVHVLYFACGVPDHLVDAASELLAGQARRNRGDGIMRVAFLGLGVMGYPMAGHLKRAGHDVVVYNRTTAKAEAWGAEHGGALAREPAPGADFVFACVGRDEDLRAVPGGAFPAMKKGAVFVDHTTASATIARELAG